MEASLPRRIWDARGAYLFLVPALIPFTLFIFIPVIYGVRLSFYQAGLTTQKWVGFDNFVQLYHDHVFRTAMINTLYFVLLVVPSGLLLSLSIAVVAHPLRMAAQSFFRFAFYMPVVASSVVLSMVWLYIYNPIYGLLNYLLTPLGVGMVDWLGGASTALPALAFVVMSWTIGQPLIIFMAGLGGIPIDLYDAASMDGANAPQRFWYVTLPLLRPVILFNVITQTIGVSQVFVVVLLMTRGGPANVTQTIVYQIYETAFTFFQLGYASAMAVVLLVILGIVAALQFKLLGQQVEY